MFFFYQGNWPRLRSFSWLQQSKTHIESHSFYQCDYHGFGILPDIFFSNIVGFSTDEEMIQFDEHICSDGLVQPPTSYDFEEKDSF